MVSPDPKRLLRFSFKGLLFLLSILAVLRLEAVEKQDFSRWEKSIAQFEKQDSRNRPPENSLLFVGSSSIRLWDLSESFPDCETINRGFGGSEIADSIHYADRIILKHKPRVVVLYAGDNDISGGKSPAEVFADFQKFVSVIHRGLPKAKIVFIAIKPSIKRWNLAEKMKKANSLIRQQCENNARLEFVDIFSPMLGADGKPRRELFVEDGLHLNQAGYKLWAEKVKPCLN